MNHRLSSLTQTIISRYQRAALAFLILLSLVTLVVALSAVGDAALRAEWPRLAGMLACLGFMLGVAWLTPLRVLTVWGQLALIGLELAAAAGAQLLTAAPLIDYIYLVLVLQGIILFRPWVWAIMAIGVWAIWAIVRYQLSNDLIGWLQSNLAIAFPATCAIIAAFIYARHVHRSEQMQSMLQQMQQRYAAFSALLREMQQRAASEERQRLLHLLASEVQQALANAEQSVATALALAQTNLGRVQAVIDVPRAAAANAIERLRAIVMALRYQPGSHEPSPRLALAGAVDETLIAPRPNHVLAWLLPSLFVSLSLGLALLQPRPLSISALLWFLALGGLLIVASACTQQVRHAVFVQLGLAAQTLTITLMAAMTNLLPLLWGLLLVAWQMASRLSLLQWLLFAAVLPLLLMVVGFWQPFVLDVTTTVSLLMAMVLVSAPLLLARYQLRRRQQVEWQVKLLEAEMQQQADEMQAITVAAERARLAREVHDDLGSKLVLINLELQLAAELAAEDAAAARDHLANSRELLHSAWQSLLAVADAELPVQGATLAAHLRRLAEQCAQSTRARVALEVQGEIDHLAAPVTHCIYRAVQEGLTNACKHARADTIAVQVKAEGGYVVVTITNNDQPDRILPPIDLGSGSFGLIGLRERAEALGGGLEAGPLPDGGWRLRLVLPAEGGG
ncbi:two-component sensor histidine kinase [Chloroflexus islandicus]|uniref:histidine kinase n=1 Tax=Chloroflexus islandicus TaxID=1707952 RepID=A0A178MEN4_9CHLR|nr:histidine kinase [Chloroflexus islandicus]OAN47230.1 two-component sensor histidine kinase [Chloroflexus islandicus]